MSEMEGSRLPANPAAYKTIFNLFLVLGEWGADGKCSPFLLPPWLTAGPAFALCFLFALGVGCYSSLGVG